jgi:PEP-CTERM motif
LNDGITRKTSRRRRRRSWYRRRLRLQRISLAVAVGALLAGVSWQSVARYFSLPTLHASQVLPESFWARRNVRKDLASMAARSARPTRVLSRVPGVYPYSVVPGGVKNTDDLRYAALRDYVVRRHYARFDFSHAKLVRATEPREVYLSYRIRDTVYWTHRRIRLHVGELLLTDGKITARARCGNQISDSAKPEVSNEEPEEDVLDQPVAEIMSAPSLTIRPLLASLDLPTGQPAPPRLFAASFIFPYVPAGAPIPSGNCRPGDEKINGRCHPKPHGPVVPEPSTFVLAGTGLAFVIWRYRNLAMRPSAIS